MLLYFCHVDWINGNSFGGGAGAGAGVDGCIYFDLVLMVMMLLLLLLLMLLLLFVLLFLLLLLLLMLLILMLLMHIVVIWCIFVSGASTSAAFPATFVSHLDVGKIRSAVTPRSTTGYKSTYSRTKVLTHPQIPPVL